jgi:hypothetical protein
VSSHSGSKDPNIEHLSAAILDPAVSRVFLATVFITLTLVVVGFLMPTRVHEPDTLVPDTSAPDEPAVESEPDAVS